MRTPRREAARSVGLLLAMLAGLMLARWGLAGGLSRPLVPATPTPPPVAGAAATPGMPELRGRLLYLGGGQLLVADAGGGPLRPLRMRVAGRTSVLRQGRYLGGARRRAAPEGAGAFGGDRRARGGHAARQRPGGAALPAARTGSGCSTGGPARRSGPSLFRRWSWRPAGGSPPSRCPTTPSRWRWWTAAYLSATCGRGWPCATWLGRERQRLGTDLTFVDATASLVAYVDDRGDLRLRDLATRRDRVVRPTGMPGWFPLGRPGRRRWLL